MTSRLARHPAYVRRIGAAAVLAGTALLGTTTGTLGDPATACAKFNGEYYGNCALWVNERVKKKEISQAEGEELLKSCCTAAEGKWDAKYGICDDPDQPPAQLPRFPDLGEATATLTPAPPAGPIVPAPAPGEATLAPAPPPAGPTTSLPSVPPAQTG